MTLISSTTIIRSLSLFHVTIAYYLLVSPHVIADQNLVVILGDAMKIPEMPSLSSPSPPTAFCGLVLALFAISDFVSATSLAGADAYEGGLGIAYWSSQALVRLLFFFGITAWVYMFRPGSIGQYNELAEGLDSIHDTRLIRTGGAHLLKNSLVFSWAFVEMLAWFWIFLTLRDERREAAERMAEKMKKAEEEALLKTD